MIETSRGRVVSLGVHIVDILGRPVTHIPPGQGGLLLDEIRITAAGTAAGTSVDLAKLGAEVIAMGAVGDDRLADFLTWLLDGYGIGTRLLARKPGLQTSATMLPIRPNGDRPALHAPGATASLTRADVDLDVIATADVLHVGGPDVLGRFAGEPLRGILEFARSNGVITTMDVLAPGDAVAWTRLLPLLTFINYFLPNEDQLGGLSGCAEGSALVTADRFLEYPAFPAQVVDTTGCGDACSAGFITGLLRGWAVEDAAWLAMAAASLVVGGLGSDAGIVDLEQTLEVLRRHSPAEVAARIFGPVP